MEKKKLTLSQTDKKIFGVCGGIAEYLGVDSTIVRILWVFASLAWGAGLFLYLLCAIIIPKPENQ